MKKIIKQKKDIVIYQAKSGAINCRNFSELIEYYADTWSALYAYDKRHTGYVSAKEESKN